MNQDDIEVTAIFLWEAAPILLPAMLLMGFVLGSLIHFLETELRYRRMQRMTRTTSNRTR